MLCLYSHPLPFYLWGNGGERSLEAAMGATNEVVTRGAEEWGPSRCIFHDLWGQPIPGYLLPHRLSSR
jgi:hypothetical protein